MSQSPAQTAPNTRQKTATSTTKKTRKELEDADGLNTAVKSKQQALAYLTAGDYIIPDKPVDLHILAHILLQFGITNKLPKPVTDGIRAVAFLIEDAHGQQTATNITEIVKTQLQEQMETFTADMEAMRDAVEHVTEAAKTITKKMDEFNDGFQETADQLAQATIDLTEKTAETANTTTPTPIQAPTTYATVAQLYERNNHAEVIARGVTADKQILIQKEKNTTDNAQPELTEKELVTKANTALDLMGWEGLDKPRHTTFVAAKKLRNGDTLYQVNSIEAAEWMRQKDVQEAFMKFYDGTSTIRNKLHYVIAEFVPITFEAGASYAHAKLEEDNTLTEQAIAFSKYIKPPHLRTENQRVAHVTIGFNHREDANSAIRNGLFIEGKHVNTRKMLTEPRRCLKCQKYGHYVTNCKESEDTCARCAEHHRTSECTITDTKAFKCSNCTGETAKGHGAADRECPRFKVEKEKNQSRMPENKYKYYPTSNPDSWRLLVETEPHSALQQPGPQQNMEQNRQHPATRHQQRFMDDWQETRRRRGRQPNQQDRTQDNGWPIRPAQTTIDGFFTNMQSGGNQRRQEESGEPPQGQARWGDRDPHEQGPGPLPENTPSGRENTRLEYA